jgi:hypothetical protein
MTIPSSPLSSSGTRAFHWQPTQIAIATMREKYSFFTRKFLSLLKNAAKILKLIELTKF